MRAVSDGEPAPDDAALAGPLEAVEHAPRARWDDLCPIPLTALAGVGPKLAEKLAEAGLRDVGDLLMWRPRRYEDRRQATEVRALGAGGFAVVRGRIVGARWAFARGRNRRYEMAVDDGTGRVRCTFFRIHKSYADKLKDGAEVTVAGRVDEFRGRLSMSHPEVDFDAAGVDGTLRPVYAPIDGIGEKRLHGLIDAALAKGLRALKEPLPEETRRRLELMDIADALRFVHRPPPGSDPATFVPSRNPALRRFVFDELFTLQMALARRRAAAAERPARAIAVPENVDAWARAVLPFEPTGAQARAIRAVARDLAVGHPMQRLLQGDVGSGKTAVAYAAARLVGDAGMQAVMMAPTEILARQHFRTLRPWFEADGKRVGLLTNGMSKAAQREVLEHVASGWVELLVGTHSVLGSGVEFPALGLAIVDEQHRFGVRQRGALRSKGVDPHLLVMSATPIPRTLSLVAFGDLDVSVIDELPPGRSPVRTTMHRFDRRDEVYQRLRGVVGQGQRAYVVLPLVEGTDKLEGVGDAVSVHAELSAGPLRDRRVGLVHGRLPGEEKAATLEAFARGDLDVLVCTTVVEVGIDVPEATVMVVEHADRFGLSQLHQLRGRVGRGALPGYCLLVAGPQPSEDGQARLRVLTGTTDGFEVARADLEMRGAGELLGTAQHGVSDLVFADIVRDARLVELAREEVERLAVQGFAPS